MQNSSSEDKALAPVLRALAIHLPQFHPVSDNDEWWGQGFTEWTNVAKAKPRFPGHYQPQLPADMGFYDLRVPETRQLQADLARQYGISGFCYYHYWFNGRRILERPVEEILRSGQPDFPFCLCWANENWSRRWDGSEQEVLLHQEYSKEDDLDHIRVLAEYFTDPRYIRVDGKPVFIVYRSELFPNIKETLNTWREEAQRLGIGELYLMRMESFSRGINPHELGFDAAVEFQPNWGHMPPRLFGSFARRVVRKLRIKESYYVKDAIYDYGQLTQNMMAKPPVKYKRYPGVMPAWDNSARRKQAATIITDSTPELYEAWLHDTVRKFTPYSPEENFIFINAWNEWAEGNHLEPCQRWGRKYLEATARVLNGQTQAVK